MKPPRSLQARALQCLAQREQSRLELRRKLMRYALADAASAGPTTDERAESDAGRGSPVSRSAPDAGERVNAGERVDAVLDWLEAQRFLSSERFVESRVNTRSARFGNLRIRQELQQHAVALTAEQAQTLADSEFDRARTVYARRFDAPSVTPAERAKRARFLIGRGFSPDVVRRVLRNAAASPDEDD